ncbi:MAG: glycosyl transferase [Bacteroidales bacterium]|nr:glycosyl transferase [Candidatus Equimonas faecalis]
MIPKTIHYCWFGRGPKNELAIKCIKSWKKFLPDYEIKEWNEDNFDVNLYPYAKEALENRKFAFVTDVVRLYALYTEGGVYMDTDVEVLKTYNPFLHLTMFSGFETDGNVPTGMMAAEKGSIWTKELLDQYDTRHFVLDDGSFDMTTNTTVITNYMLTKGLILNNKYQDFPDLCTMYPAEYFCPKDHTTGKIHITDKTVCIHHFAGSWVNHTWWDSTRHKLKVLLVNIVGENIGKSLSNFVTGRAFTKK